MMHMAQWKTNTVREQQICNEMEFKAEAIYPKSSVQCCHKASDGQIHTIGSGHTGLIDVDSTSVLRLLNGLYKVN